MNPSYHTTRSLMRRFCDRLEADGIQIVTHLEMWAVHGDADNLRTDNRIRRLTEHEISAYRALQTLLLYFTGKDQ